MNIIDGIIKELEHESISTRQHLERIPDDKLGWKPHEKSMPMGALGSHIAESLGWTVVTVKEPSYDIPADFKPWQGASAKEIVEKYDAAYKDAIEAMTGVPNEALFVNWKLSMNGVTIFEMPRIVTIRMFLLNHSIHHRAQLGVYLRLNNVAVPSTYGPSADEGDKKTDL